jgi:hypothetical protein
MQPLNFNTMWQKIAEKTWDFFLWLDRKHIKKFDYETAPYCGHHHCGHDGKYTETHYHEGDGGGNNKRLLWLININFNNVDTGRCHYQLILFPPLFNLFIWIKTFHKRFKIGVKRDDKNVRWFWITYKRLYKSQYKFFYAVRLYPFKVYNINKMGKP